MKREKNGLIQGICAAALVAAGAAAAYPAPWGADVSTPEKLAAVQERCWKHDVSKDVKVWPEGKVPFRKGTGPIKFKNHELNQSNVVIGEINDPQFTFFAAPGEGAKPVVVVLPGGGYFQLGWNKEGTEIAEWLNRNGYSAAVLLYRVPGQRKAALCDTQRTISLLRHDAQKYNIDPRMIGVIGFSAGANLAVWAATSWKERAYEKVDEADDVSCRPDFQIPIYPWDLLPDNVRKDHLPVDQLKREYPVGRDTPPAFIMQAQDDFCKVETAVGYYLALQRQGVPCELHVYPFGGHGYGLRKLGTPCDNWSDAAAIWLKGLKAWHDQAGKRQGKGRRR